MNIRTLCDSVMVAGPGDTEAGSSTGSATGSGGGSGGLGELKLAQARKRKIEDELYRTFGTSHSEQSPTSTLTIPSDLETEYVGEDLLDSIILFMRQQVLSFPLPFVYVQYAKESYRSELGISRIDISTLPDNVKAEFDIQNTLLFKALHDRLNQSQRDRLYNTHSFSQSFPTITIEGGVQRHDGLGLVFSLAYINREDHSVIESRVRNSLYSYHLALRTQPLPEVVDAIRADLALAKKAGVRLSWSESGAKWVDVVAARSILLGQELAPFAPQGSQRAQLVDTNDAILTLFSLIDQIANATKRTSTAEDQQVHGAFQIGNPGVRQAWSNAVNPSQDNRNHARAPSDGAHRYTFKGKSKGKGAMQGYGKGKGRSKGKGKGKRVFAQFAAPRTTGVKRCPAIGCTQLLTSKRDKTVCESCFRSSLTNPIQLTNGQTFPYRNAYKGKGSHKGPTRPPMQGKGKRSSPYPPRFRPPLLNVNHVEVSWDQHVENGTGFISAPDSEVRGTMGMSPIRPPASKMHYSDDCWCGATSTCRTQ